MKLSSLLCVFILIALAWPARADDTAFGGRGASPMPIGQAEIEMVSESVVISGSDLEGGGEGRWNASCDFTFRNTSDKSIKLSVGFPFPVREDEGPVTVPQGRKARVGDPLVYDFKVTVNGKPVKAVRTKIKPNRDLGQYYSDAYIWKMEFGPKQTVKVHHDYITGITWDVMGYSWAGYVLKTGGNWKGGRIGSAHIEVIPNALVILCKDVEKQADYLKPKPKGMKTVGRGAEKRFVWDLKNFRPEEDLDLCMQTARHYAERRVLAPVIMYGDVEEQLAKLGKDELRILRNTVFAKYGRTFKDEKLQRHFEAQWWYVPDPAYSDSMLGADDKKILSDIMREEGRR